MWWRRKSPASRLFTQPFIRAQIKENITKLHVTGLCAGNSPVTGKFPAQRASNAEDVSIWWRHHDINIQIAIFHKEALLLSTEIYVYIYVHAIWCTYHLLFVNVIIFFLYRLLHSELCWHTPLIYFNWYRYCNIAFCNKYVRIHIRIYILLFVFHVYTVALQFVSIHREVSTCRGRISWSF